MRVGIDITGLFWKYRTGVQNYYHGLIDGLAGLDWRSDDVEIVFIDRSIDGKQRLSIEMGDRFEYRSISSLPWLSTIDPVRHHGATAWGARLWNHGVRELKAIAALSQRKTESILEDIDVLQVWNWEIISAPRTAQVITIHDVIPILYSELYPKAFVRSTQASLHFARHEARRVIAVSEFTKREAQRVGGIPEEKITVVHSGVRPIFKPSEGCQSTEAVRKRYGIYGCPYLVSVGFLDPRKNVKGHVGAFEKLVGSGNYSDLQLVLVGPETYTTAQLLQEVKSSQLRDRIHFTGYVPDEHLVALLNGASAFLYCSLYEGFGFPVLEAMACGTPVITSNSTALAEISCGASVQVDPNEPEEIAAAIERVLTDSQLREELRRKGPEHARQFNWQKAAAQHLEVYREASS